MIVDDALFLYSGGFAVEVLDAARVAVGRRLAIHPGLTPGEIPAASAIVAVLPAGFAEVHALIDHVGADRRLPTSVLELFPTRIVLGPSVLPGRTACHACLAAERREHTPGADDRLSRLRGLPEGFAPHDVLIGAGLLLRAFDRLSAAAELVSYDCVHGTMTVRTVNRHDGCPRCGEPAAPPHKEAPEHAV
ncbi:hypothetical protein [Sphaerisporangium fuscum]|uniref:hypothetical protein n=1 Tax=Sphaerisporangium fuscum TaxID=2835868 RepID=UPI001BDD4244|nr:hypothetical protein [Sphaerisporangium fuscum]